MKMKNQNTYLVGDRNENFKLINNNKNLYPILSMI